MKKKLIVLTIFVFFGFLVQGATQYVNNPTSCNSSDATNFPGQNCSPLDICGDNSGIAQCYDTSTIGTPPGDVNSTTNYSGSFDGGFILNCYASVDASAPFCDNSGNFWCDRDSTCNNVHRVTQCNAGKWSGDAGDTTCQYCSGSYIYCDGSYTDADGCEVLPGSTSYPSEANAHYNSSCSPECNTNYNDCDADLGSAGTGCEILNGSACSVGALSGTYSTCTCVVPTQNFVTGVQAEYNSDQNFLWGRNYSHVGNLIFFYNPYSLETFRVDVNANLFSDNNIMASWVQAIDVNANNFCLSNDCINSWSDVNSGSGGSGSTEYYTAGGNLVLDSADNNKFHFNDTNFLTTFHAWSSAQLFNSDLNNFVARTNLFDLNVGETGIRNNSVVYSFEDLNTSAVANCSSDNNSVLNSQGQCVSISNFHVDTVGAGGSGEPYFAGGNLVLSNLPDTNTFHFNDVNWTGTQHVYTADQNLSGKNRLSFGDGTAYINSASNGFFDLFATSSYYRLIVPTSVRYTNVVFSSSDENTGVISWDDIGNQFDYVYDVNFTEKVLLGKEENYLEQENGVTQVHGNTNFNDDLNLTSSDGAYSAQLIMGADGNFSIVVGST